jgi:glucosylceramidase
MKTGRFCLLIIVSAIFFNASCSRNSGNNTLPVIPGPDTPTNPPTGAADVESWITTGNLSQLLAKQNQVLSFGTVASNLPFIDVDSSKSYQTVDGFGYTLTSGSARLVNSLSVTSKTNLLRQLFTTEAGDAIGVNYLRISIGASDLSDSVYSYNDLPAGQTDVALARFSLGADTTDLIPLLKEILTINPAIKILATPWSPPVWMKDNGSSKGGHLKPEYYGVYAQYFVKYIEHMKVRGITVDAITPQNEPLHPGNNPSLEMFAEQQRDFIKNNLGPAFKAAGITTKIITYDHNANHPEYPLTVLKDVAANAFVDGSAFHLYEGQISALSEVHNAYPNKNIYFTEQYTASTGEFAGDLKWHLKNVIIGSMRNWSRTALEWNLASDAQYKPYTEGGCTTCKGALIIDAGQVYKNVAFYIIAHASKFVPAGSVRIESNVSGDLQNVAFKRPDGKKVLIVENDGDKELSFNIRYKARWATAKLAAGAVGTYIW